MYIKLADTGFLMFTGATALQNLTVVVDPWNSVNPVIISTLTMQRMS